MTVKMKEMIDSIISSKEDNPMLLKIIKSKMILHGIDRDRLATEPYDDPLVIAKIEKLAREVGAR